MMKRSLIENKCCIKNNQKGITIMALVITVIVLLILSTITIYNLTDKDSSMLTSVENKREEMLKMEAKQAIEVAAEKVKLEHTSNKTLTFQQFTDELKKELQKNDKNSDVNIHFNDELDGMYDATFNGYTFSYYYDVEINKLIKIEYEPQIQYTQSGIATISTTVKDADIQYYFFSGNKPEEITTSKIATINWLEYNNKLNINKNGTLYAKLNINGTSSEYIYKYINNIDYLKPVIENINVNNKVYEQITFTADIYDDLENTTSLSSGIETINIYLDGEIIKTFDKPTTKTIEYTQENLVPATVHKYYLEAIDKVGNKTQTTEQQVTVLGEFDLQVKYYLENVDDNNYTLANTQKYLAEYDKQLNLVDYAIDIENGTYSYASLTASELGAESSKIETTKMGAGMTIAMYYTRNKGPLTIKYYLENADDTKYGIYENITVENIKHGTIITLTDYKKDITNGTYSYGSLIESEDGGTAVTTTTMEADTTICLYYSRNTYTLTLAKRNYISAVSATPTNTDSKYKVGQNVTIDATLASYTGYTVSWSGWTSSNTNLIGNTSVKNATITMPAGDIKLTANGTRSVITYTVTYNANGGTGAPASQTKTYGVNLTLSSTVPTKSGYTFLGWSASSTATTATYQPGGTYTANSSATLYAVWKMKTYTITYDANGGSGAPASQIKAHGVNLTLSSTVPTKSENTFAGWSTSSTATTAEYSAGGTYSTDANVTLYAVWITNKINIYSSSDDGGKTTSIILPAGTTVNYTVTKTHGASGNRNGVPFSEGGLGGNGTATVNFSGGKTNYTENTFIDGIVNYSFVTTTEGTLTATALAADSVLSGRERRLHLGKINLYRKNRDKYELLIEKHIYINIIKIYKKTVDIYAK